MLKRDNAINRIHLQDCRLFMHDMEGSIVDVILTSPPYNTARKVKTKRGLDNLENRYIKYQDDKTDQEYMDWTIQVMDGFHKVLKQNGVVLYNLSYSSENTTLMWKVIADIIQRSQFVVADCIIWKKKSAIPNNVSPNKLTRIVEFVFVLCRKGEIDTFVMNKPITGVMATGQKNYANIFNLVEAANNDGPVSNHKATYSTDLCYKLLNMYAPPQSVVYDPFMGTGTTAIACKSLGHTFIGTEVTQEYVDYANKRINDYDSQLKIL